MPDIPLLIDVEEGAFTDIALNNVNETKTNVTDPTNSFVLRYVTETIVYEGSPLVAVVNYTKDWFINGSGIDKVPGIRDKAKWVPNEFTNKQECGSPNSDVHQDHRWHSLYH